MQRLIDLAACVIDVCIAHPATWLWHGAFGCDPKSTHTDFTRESGLKVTYCLTCGRVLDAKF